VADKLIREHQLFYSANKKPLKHIPSSFSVINGMFPIVAMTDTAD